MRDYSFNPQIDRYDRTSAARLFARLYDNGQQRLAIERNLAQSIRVAHGAGPASWEITMFSDSVRLNVGQVEVMKLYSAGVKFLFHAPLEANPGIQLDLSDSPVYPAVPVPSGTCLVPATQVFTLPAAVRKAHDLFIEAAASRKTRSPFKRSFSPALLDYLELSLEENLPRPEYLIPAESSLRVVPLADEVPVTLPIREGAKYQLTVNAYERDPTARNICITEYGAKCAVCGMSFGEVYGPQAAGFIHVHHLRPLTEIGHEYQVDPIKDLIPLCPNCHAVVHLRTPPFRLDEVRQLLSICRSA